MMSLEGAWGLARLQRGWRLTIACGASRSLRVKRRHSWEYAISSSASNRDRAAHLAKTNFSDALTVADEVEDPSMRAQAFAWVARFAPDEAVVELADEAFDAAGRADDEYKSVMAAAWPVRALIERGHTDHARTMLERTLAHTSEITSPGAIAEALFGLLEAAHPGELWRPVVEQMVTRCTDTHWRTVRALKGTVRLIAELDRPLAERVASMLEPSVREPLLADMMQTEPRKFFG